MKYTDIIKNTINIFVDLILPKTCAICNKKLKYHESSICINCITKLSYINQSFYDIRNRISCIDPRFQKIYSIYSYYKGSFSRILIHALKYKGRKDVAKFIVDSSLNHIKINNIDIIIAVPAEISRKYNRGYNQTLLLAKEIAKNLNIKHCYDDIILRKKYSHSQTTLEKYERELNIKNAFYIDKNKIKLIENKNILLVDDVLTSGATLSNILDIITKENIKTINIFVSAIAI